MAAGDKFGDAGHGPKKEIHRVKWAEAGGVPQPLKCILGPSQKAIGGSAHSPSECRIRVEMKSPFKHFDRNFRLLEQECLYVTAYGMHQRIRWIQTHR